MLLSIKINKPFISKVATPPLLYYNVYTKEEGLILMTVISLRIDTQEDKLIKEYAKANNISVSALFRNSVLEKIEDEIDLGLYNQAMMEHKSNPQSISFEDMLKELSD